jgi:hypothetical protein
MESYTARALSLGKKGERKKKKEKRKKKEKEKLKQRKYLAA